MHYSFRTAGVCSRQIDFDMNDDGTVNDIRFLGGCDGNLKAIAKLLEGAPADRIIDTLQGNTCGTKPTSCTDQLAKAVSSALEKRSLSGR